MRYTYFHFACLIIVAALLSALPASAGPPTDDDLSSRTSGEITATDRQYWTYQPVHRPDLPSVKDTSWPRSPIDCFVLARLESQQLSPVSPADRRAILRRATFDLTGLPPTPAEMDAFVRDQSSESLSRVLDRLLASPRYGERWARHWLDVARYGQDIRPNNYLSAELPMAYRYRDWVIRALNEDVPYDRFVMMQLAVAGTLNGAMGGRSQPDLFSSRRRTIYGRISRDNSTATDKFLRLFDFPDANISNSQRTQTTVPQQQLFVMNNLFVLAQADALSRRLMGFTDDQQFRIHHAFAVAYGRVPSAEELRHSGFSTLPPAWMPTAHRNGISTSTSCWHRANSCTWSDR